MNTAYDAFTAKYGLLNDRKNGRLFEQDSSYYLLCSLENLDEQGQLKSKAAMFTKRTIRPERTVTSVDTPSEALAVSIGEHGKVDLPYMAELLGTPGEYGRITTELSGVIFKDPAADPTDPEAGWQMADEYLSGDVRAKLRMAQFAAETNPAFAVNVEALTKAQPRELEASEIDVRLGATWLDPDIIQKFMTETFQIPYYLRHAVKVRYSPYTAEWRVEGKTATGRSDIISSETYGTSRANAYKILEETLNLKDVRIYDTIEDAEGKPKRVLNKRETMLAQQKQQVIKDAFANWVWQDPPRRIALVKQYNELFNSTRPREYDGSHIKFVGMNPEITLREHQRNAINDIIISAIQQNIGMVIFQIVVSCLHCIIHDIFRTSDMEIRMGHMDVLIRILLDKVQLSGACRAAPHDHRFGGPAVLAARQQHRPACFCFRICNDEGDVALLAAESLEDSLKLALAHELCEGAVRSVVYPPYVSETLRADAAYEFGLLVDLLSGELCSGALCNDTADGAAVCNSVLEYGESAVLYDIGDVGYLHAKAGIRLIGAVTGHSLVVGQAGQGSGNINVENGLVEVLYEALQALEDIVNVNEGHLEVDLCELRLAVCAEILVAEAACKLDISVHARDHQELLVHLRGLRQCVELAVVDTGRHDVVARALWGGLYHHRGLDLGEAVCVEVLAGCLCYFVAHHEVLLERLAAQVEVAVLEA